MSTPENSRQREEFVEYYHREQDDEEQSQSSDEDAGNAIAEILMKSSSHMRTVSS